MLLQECVQLAGEKDGLLRVPFGQDAHWKSLPKKLAFRWWDPQPTQDIESHAKSLVDAVEKFCRNDFTRTYEGDKVRSHDC